MDCSIARTVAARVHTTASASATSRRSLALSAQRGELVRIARGYYLDAEVIASHPQPLEVVAFARLLALQHKHPHLIASGPTAAWLRGLPLLREHPPHVTTTSNHHPRPITLPAIHVGSLHFHSSTVRPHRPRGGRSPAMIRYGGDVIGSTVEDTIIDCALTLDQEEAFVIACAGLHELARYSRFYRDDSRQREERNRSRLLRTLGPSKQGVKHAKSARWVLEHADAGCDSAGESRLLYILLRGGITGLETQYPVTTVSGRYFIDVAVPEARIGIEFDGRGKYGSDVDTIHRSIEAEERRQRLLEGLGWRIRRFRWAALPHADEILGQVRYLLGRG